MAQKVESEGKKEQELFEKYMCYCQTGESDLKESVDAVETKIPQLQSSIEEATAEKQSSAKTQLNEQSRMWMRQFPVWKVQQAFAT